MATTALVGIEKRDGTIEYRKVYSDGYLSHTGVFLLKHLDDGSLDDFEDDRYVSEGLNCGELKTAKNEEDFIKTWFCVCEHYLYRRGKWYNGSWGYSDGYLHDIYTGEKTKKVGEEKLRCYHGWEPLEKKFKKKRRVIYDYIEIEPQGE